MTQLIAAILIVAAGAVVGGILGLVAGAAVFEAGHQTCEGAACADTVVRTFFPIGIFLGALLGLNKARSFCE